MQHVLLGVAIILFAPMLQLMGNESFVSWEGTVEMTFTMSNLSASSFLDLRMSIWSMNSNEKSTAFSNGLVFYHEKKTFEEEAIRLQCLCPRASPGVE